MRTIRKTTEPSALGEWRSRYKNDINFGYALMRGDKVVVEALMDSLLAEQGGLCAYTGIRVRVVDGVASAHIEHATPQSNCASGEDVAYTNLHACVPAPNSGTLAFGAHKKANWPPPDEAHLFVRPTTAGCTQRFTFSLSGEISASSATDVAAKETIVRLGLDDPELTKLRAGAIQGLLGLRRKTRRGSIAMDARRSRQRLKALQAAEETGDAKEQFSFVLIQALERHIHRLNAIRARKSG